MNCDEAKILLSPFHDGQLDEQTTARMTAHVEQCPDCAKTLQGYGELSDLARRSVAPQIPSGCWQKVDQQLDEHSVATSTSDSPPTGRRFSTRKIASVLTLSVLLLAAAFLLPHAFHDHHELAVDFDHYLEVYAEDPDRAAELLFAEYPAEEVDIETAARQVGYRPVVANTLPDGYSIDSIHIMKMPCCTCVKTVCRNERGAPFVVFEHDAEQPLWFGNRQKRDCDCGGMPTSVVDFDEQIAATWQFGKRSVTIVGIKDTEEITQLMPFLGRDPGQS